MALVEQLPRARRRILDCYLGDEIDSRQATTLLGVSVRQFWRLLAAYRASGAKSLTHGNRGRRPSNATSPAVAARVIELARDRYPDANQPTLPSCSQNAKRYGSASRPCAGSLPPPD